MRARPTAICRPTSDVAFAHAVQRCLATRDLASPDELEAALSPLFPTIKVRRRAASESGPVWMVSRGPETAGSRHPRWWARQEVPAIMLRASNGTIVGFNDEAAGLFGRDADDLIGRPYTDLIDPSVVDAAAGIWDLLLEIGFIETVAAVVRADGSRAVVELRARRDGDVVEARYRPIAMLAAQA